LACNLLIQRSILPFEIDGDIWTHYLPYFINVIESHSIWPNDIWYHFYVSKFAAFHINAILLGDILSPPLISWCFLIFIAVISYDIVIKITGERIFSLIAPISILEITCISGAIANFQKHHMIIAGLVLFIAWCVVFLSIKNREECKKVFAAGILSSFYLGLFMPLMSPVITLGCLASSLSCRLLSKFEIRTVKLSAIGLSCILGAIVTLSMNYLITGLMLDSPIKFTSDHGNMSRFAKYWDPMVFQYWFLGIGAVEGGAIGLEKLVIPNFSWLFQILRSSYLYIYPPIWALLLFCVFIGPSNSLRKRINSLLHLNKNNCILIIFILFLVGTLIPANIFPDSGSMYRLYGFSAYLLIIIISSITIFLIIESSCKDLYRTIIFCITVLIISTSFFILIPKDSFKSAYFHISGINSIAEIIQKIDKKSPVPGEFEYFEAAKNITTRNSKILYFGYSSTPGYVLPYPAILNEPSYAFGTHYRELLYGESEASKEILISMGINYFLFNMKSRLFLGIPYSELFRASSLGKIFNVVWEKDGYYLLTWKGDIGSPPSDNLISMLEFKQKSIIPKLKIDMQKYLEKGDPIIEGDDSLNCTAKLALISQMKDLIEIQESKKLIDDFQVYENCKSTVAPTRQFNSLEGRKNALNQLYEFLKMRWGNDVTKAIWDLKLSEDINSEDFGWLYEKNRLQLER
jgi:hypothetical protein